MDIITLIHKSGSPQEVKEIFQARLREGVITRDENPKSHFCIYFAAYCKASRKVFIGHHLKSGLWLFNGGHIDRGESASDALYREMREEWGFEKQSTSPLPSLLTITEIENPMKQTCKVHYDIWNFIPFEIVDFNPQTNLLSKEFLEWGWKSIEEATTLMTDPASQEALREIALLF